MEPNSPRLTKYLLLVTALLCAAIDLAHRFGLLGPLEKWIEIPDITLLTVSAVLAVLATVYGELTKLTQDVKVIKSHQHLTTLEHVDGLRHKTHGNLKMVADQHINSLLDNIVSVYRDDTLLFNDVELFRTIYKSALGAFPDARFHATSIPDDKFFWGNRSVELAIARFIWHGGTMERIFFLDSYDDLHKPNVQRVLRTQHTLGVAVYVSLLSRVPYHLRRFFMVDDRKRICWEPVRGPDNEIVSTCLSANEKLIADFLGMFEQLRALDCSRRYHSSPIGLDLHQVGKRRDEKAIDVDRFTEFEKRGWERSATKYHQYFGSLTTQMSGILLPALARPGQARSGRLLDLACGPAYLAREALQRGYDQVVGLDFSDSMVSLARSLSQGCPKDRLSIVEADATDIPFPENSFDAVVMNFGLLHLARPELAVAEANRVLEPGGKAAFTVWALPEKSAGLAVVLAALEAFAEPDDDLPQGPPFFFYSDRANMAALLDGAGFSDVAVREVELKWSLRSGRDLFRAFMDGTARTGGVLRSQNEETLQAIQRSIEQNSAEYRAGRMLQVPMSVISGIGTKRG